MNGEPIERILDRLETHILRVEVKVDNINSQGCAHRKDDLRRIEELESYKNKGIIGLIILAIVTILNSLGIKI